MAHSLTHSLTHLLTYLLSHAIVKAEVDGSNGSSVMPFVIPLDILSHMYAVPVVMSPLIHTSIHWNTLLYVGLSDLLSLLTSLLIPIVLMLYVADKQTPYYNRSNDNSWQVRTYLLICSLIHLLTHYPEVYKYSKNCGICSTIDMPTGPPYF